MGNVPTKERQRLQTFSGSSQASRNGRRTTLFSAPARRPSARAEEKLSAKERQLRQLIIRHHECVDGGFLAPHGIYKSNLDFDAQTVRKLVVERRLAPFYTPLQDFDASWTEAEVAALVQQSPLHAVEAAYSEEEEDDDHRIHRPLNLQRKQELKMRMLELAERIKSEKERAEADYVAAAKGDKWVSSRDLVVRLYARAAECPICFLFFPPNLNISRCCRQPICSECFVQIRRLDPHPPHDEHGNEQESSELISEPASCPYCAMANFGVTYEPLRDVRVGIDAQIAPGEFRACDISAIPENDEDGDEVVVDSAELTLSPPKNARKPRRRSSIAADSELVVTTDFIRPDWELKLLSARSRMARKAATASAIHASNLLIDEDGSPPVRNPPYLVSLEDQMIEEAMRLSLLDEDDRKKKLKH